MGQGGWVDGPAHEWAVGGGLPPSQRKEAASLDKLESYHLNIHTMVHPDHNWMDGEYLLACNLPAALQAGDNS